MHFKCLKPLSICCCLLRVVTSQLVFDEINISSDGGKMDERDDEDNTMVRGVRWLILMKVRLSRDLS